jgi:hypothetical protein
MHGSNHPTRALRPKMEAEAAPHNGRPFSSTGVIRSLQNLTSNY